MVAKPTDIVKFPQDWPHIALQCDKVGGAYTFQELDVRLFVTGELELLSSHSISPEEHEGRIRLLKQLMYLSKLYEWQVILKLYTEVVSKIERGFLIWNSNFEATINCGLQRHGNTKQPTRAPFKSNQYQTQKKGSGYKTRPTYCKEFQSNACTSLEDKHWAMVNGERMMVEHVCAVCLIKKRESHRHSEISPDCPSRGMRQGQQ